MPNTNPSFLDLQLSGSPINVKDHGSLVAPSVMGLNFVGAVTVTYDSPSGYHVVNVQSGAIGTGLADSLYSSNGTVNGWKTIAQLGLVKNTRKIHLTGGLIFSDDAWDPDQSTHDLAADIGLQILTVGEGTEVGGLPGFTDDKQFPRSNLSEDGIDWITWPFPDATTANHGKVLTPSGTTAGLYVLEDPASLPFASATFLTIDNETSTLPNSLPVAANRLSGGGVVIGINDNGINKVFFIDVPFGTTGSSYAAGNDSRFTKINGATAPSSPVSGDAGKILYTPSAGVYALAAPSAINILTTTNADTSTLVKRNIYTDPATGYRSIDYERIYVVGMVNGATQALNPMIYETDYHGDGELAGGHWAELTIEVTLLLMGFDHSGGGGTLSSTGHVTQGTWRFAWSKFRPLGGSPTGSWNHNSVGELTALHSGDDWATDMGISILLDHSGTHDGDITINFNHVTGTWATGQTWSTAKFFVRIYGGGRYA